MQMQMSTLWREKPINVTLQWFYTASQCFTLKCMEAHLPPTVR